MRGVKKDSYIRSIRVCIKNYSIGHNLDRRDCCHNLELFKKTNLYLSLYHHEAHQSLFLLVRCR